MTDGVAAYDASVAKLCEGALVTVIGRAGYWGRHLYLVGGLAPRYLTPADPSLTMHGPHAGTRDVDLAVVLAVDEHRAGYATLVRAIRESRRWPRLQSPVIEIEPIHVDPDLHTFGLPPEGWKKPDGRNRRGCNTSIRATRRWSTAIR